DGPFAAPDPPRQAGLHRAAPAMRGVRPERLLPLVSNTAQGPENRLARLWPGPSLLRSRPLPQPAHRRQSTRQFRRRQPSLLRHEHLFYHGAMESVEPRLTDVEYLEVQCKSALNRVKGMFFEWSLNPYTGCEHRCAFCYVRAFELRADRPSDDRYGRTVRVKLNVAGVLRSELS